MAVDIRKKEPDMNDGYALEFDGTDDYVDLGFDLYNENEVTVEFIINWKNMTDSYQFIIGQFDSFSNAFGARTSRNGVRTEFTFYTEEDDDGANTGTTIELGKYYRISYVFNNGKIKLYKNGIIVVETNFYKDTTPDLSGNFKIGYHEDSSVNFDYFDGLIDDVRFWDVARTQKEIQNNLFKKLNGDENGLVAYYKMDEGSGNTLNDAVGSYNATIYGASWHKLNWEDGTLNNVVAINDNLELENNPALEFDGVDDYVEIFDSSEVRIGQNNFKITADIYIKNRPQDYHTFISKGQTGAGEFLFYDSKSKLRFYADGGNIVLEHNEDLPTNKWIKVAFERDGDNGYLYIDGEEVESTSGIENVDIDTTKDISISASEEGSDRFFEGLIDDVVLEIDGNVVAEYKINESSGSTLTDSAGDNDGTIYGATWITEDIRYFTTGTRQSPQLDISEVGEVESNLIEWKGIYGDFLKFDGEDNYAHISDKISALSDPHNDYTIILNMKVLSFIDRDVLLYHEENKNNERISLTVDTYNGENYIGWHATYGSGANVIKLPSNFAQVVLVYNESDSSTEIYLNKEYGSSDSDQDIVNVNFDSPENKDEFWVGRMPEGNHPEFQLASLYVFSSAFSQSEVEDFYDNQNYNENDLEMLWSIDEGSGSTLTDSAGDNDGTIYGADWVNTTLEIETSVDDGDTWDTCTNGDPIPNIDGASTLDIRQTLETDDTTVTPVLESLTVDIDTADSNDDSGGFSATFDKKFQVIQTDEGVFTSQEDNKLLPFVFTDSGSFYKDAENWETFIFEVVLDEDKLTSSIDFDTFHNWARKPIKEEVWNKQDSPTSQWTKKDRPSTDWQKED